MMKEPIEPKTEDCCNSGCNPCVFDVYQKQLEAFKKFLNGVHVDVPVSNAISQLHYTEFVVVKSIEVCNSHKLILFKQLKLDNSYKLYWDPGDHFLIMYKNDNIICTRAYTPLSPSICSNDHEDIKIYDFGIIAKRYLKGIVSNYLYNLNPGQITSWRGPYGSYKIDYNNYKRIIMIAQGTGVLPFISIVEKLLDCEDAMTNIILYYCCEDIDRILFRDKLYAQKSYWNFAYKIFLSNFDKSVTLKYLEPVISHKMQIEDFSALLPFTIGDQFLLSGSCNFMEEYKEAILTLKGVALNIHLF